MTTDSGRVESMKGWGGDSPLEKRLRCASVGQQDRDRCLQCHCCIINSRSKTYHRNQDREPGRNTRTRRGTMTISEMLIGSKDRGTGGLPLLWTMMAPSHGCTWPCHHLASPRMAVCHHLASIRLLTHAVVVELSQLDNQNGQI